MVCTRPLVSSFLIISLSSFMQIGEIYFYSGTLFSGFCSVSISTQSTTCLWLGGWWWWWKPSKLQSEPHPKTLNPLNTYIVNCVMSHFARCLIRLNKQAK